MFKAIPIEVAIDIPSGYIVFSDDLRDPYNVPESKRSPQNATGPLWQKMITKAYGEAGLFHGYVGNSCPSIHKHDGKFIIGTSSYDEKTYETRDDLPGEYVGAVITDLWWYSLADKDNLVQLLKEQGSDTIEETNFDGMLKVDPGRYVLKHYYPYFGKYPAPKGSKYEVYAVLERSDSAIKEQRLPDEGIADMLMRNPLGEIKWACVEADKDKIDEINEDESLIFEYYEIFTHWVVPEAGSLFTRPKFTGAELQDHGIVKERSIEHRSLEVSRVIKQRRVMKELEEGLKNMAPEERARHDREVKEMLNGILSEIRAERREK